MTGDFDHAKSQAKRQAKQSPRADHPRLDFEPNDEDLEQEEPTQDQYARGRQILAAMSAEDLAAKSEEIHAALAETSHYVNPRRPVPIHRVQMALEEWAATLPA